MVALAKLLAGIRTPATLVRTLRYRAVPAIEHRHLADLDVNTVIDIGANRGQFSLVAREIWDGCQIIAFEPLDEEADAFEACVPGATMHRVGVGAFDGPGTIHVSRQRDSSSLLPIGPAQIAAYPRTSEVGQRAIEIVTLDSAAKDVELLGNVLMKLDIQGGELDAIRGAVRTLGITSFVYIELSFTNLYLGQPLAAEVVHHLSTAGFDVLRVANVTSHAGVPIQADFLFGKSEQ